MEEFDISTAAIVEHVLISCLPWLIGTTVGGALGVLFALGNRAVLSASPALRRPSVLLPWRTLVAAVFMAVFSPFIVGLLGLGPITGGVMVGSSVCLLAMAFTASTLAESWHPSPLGVHLVAGARTLAVASGLIAAAVGLLGVEGSGTPSWKQPDSSSTVSCGRDCWWCWLWRWSSTSGWGLRR